MHSNFQQALTNQEWAAPSDLLGRTSEQAGAEVGLQALGAAARALVDSFRRQPAQRQAPPASTPQASAPRAATPGSPRYQLPDSQKPPSPAGAGSAGVPPPFGARGSSHQESHPPHSSGGSSHQETLGGHGVRGSSEALLQVMTKIPDGSLKSAVVQSNCISFTIQTPGQEWVASNTPTSFESDTLHGVIQALDLESEARAHFTSAFDPILLKWVPVASSRKFSPRA